MRYGYACLNLTLKEQGFKRRALLKKQFLEKGLSEVCHIAKHNLDLLKQVLLWNEAHSIKMFRFTDLFPWMDQYQFEDLPYWRLLSENLLDVGSLVLKLGHRLTNHPSEFCVLGSPTESSVLNTVGELNQVGRLLDLMGLDKSPFYKINIHIGGTYGNKRETAKRFIGNFLGLLTPSVRSRLTVENEDKTNGFSVVDLYDLIYQEIKTPIVFDYFHHEFNNGGMSQGEALAIAVSTWPEGIMPVVHYSEARGEGPARAHSEYIDKPIDPHGFNIDVMIESKGTEKTVLRAMQTGLLPH